MTITVTLRDLHRCSRISPEILVANAPDGTRTFDVRLVEYGDEERFLIDGGSEDDGSGVIRGWLNLAIMAAPALGGPEQDYAFVGLGMGRTTFSPWPCGFTVLLRNKRRVRPLAEPRLQAGGAQVVGSIHSSGAHVHGSDRRRRGRRNKATSSYSSGSSGGTATAEVMIRRRAGAVGASPLTGRLAAGSGRALYRPEGRGTGRSPDCPGIALQRAWPRAGGQGRARAQTGEGAFQAEGGVQLGGCLFCFARRP